MAETILNRRIVMASRPTGMPAPENFRLEEVEEPRAAPEGGVLLKTLFFSLDPYMRGRMDAGPSYAQALEPGDVMEGGSVCEVLASRDAAVQAGRHRAGRNRLADPPAGERQGPAQDRSGAGAGVDRTRHSRHAGDDGLYRASQHRHAEARRDAGGGGGERGGGLCRGADRQDQGLPRRRHRRRARRRRATSARNWASTWRSTTARRISRAAEGGVPRWHRHLFRECRRRGVGPGAAPAQQFCARAGVRADRAVQWRGGRRGWARPWRCAACW